MSSAPGGDNAGGARSRFKAGRSAANKFLTFTLGTESYGIPILKVQEIIGMTEVTPVPRMPEWARGVINLRGKVIPVVDLRRTFGMDPVPDTRRTCVVVAQVAATDGQVVMGCVVDLVNEVQNIPANAIEPPPAFCTTVDTAFIVGMGMAQKKVIILLDIDKVLSHQALAEVLSQPPPPHQ